MCHPGWKRARLAAQRLRDLAHLRRVRDRIDREYARPLDVEELARGADMAAGHLSREFRLAYGRSPYGYLTARRVAHATALLRRGGLGETEVSAAVGCPSHGVFRSRFTELVGVEPAAYRRHAAAGAAAPAVHPPARGGRPVRNREASDTEQKLASTT
ncbi:AraC family transcriptional regulator [Streptomyces sp. ms191]|uniref:helix-turn-helix domain-containing protein n=1 Tax=Streptomyces sp. ms191 TaxID=1827978 RepID=UPI0011CE44BC|nr:AraC family transcriptional regulator [Streptomyces sp. ms191]TXS26121.1 AraC family transcriptional regulator [Streptomyces sp. ms191]